MRTTPTTEATEAAARLRRRPVKSALATLALVTFVVGTAELMIVGILSLIAADTGVSIRAAGYLVTAYALGIAFGAPAISAATARFGRRLVLRAALLAFIAGNVVAVVASGFEMLLLVRVVTGSLHGLIAGVATAIAASVVPPERRGQAISLVVGGITVSTVVGVPAGTMIGQALGWRAAFLTVLAFAAVAFAATLRFVPDVGSPNATGVGAQVRAAFGRRVLAILAVGLVIYAGQFTAFTYLEPFLTEVTGIPTQLTSLFLLAFGLAALVGTLAGGRFADRSATTTLLVASGLLAGALAAVYLSEHLPPLVLVSVAAWGLAGFAVAPALMVRAITVARGGTDLVPTLVISVINAGIAAGSLIGGVVISSSDAAATVVTALVIVAAALPVIWASNRLQPGAATVLDRSASATRSRTDKRTDDAGTDD